MFMPRGVYKRTKIKPLAERFSAKVHKQKGGCWIWHGARNSFGHGQLYRGGPKSGGRRLLIAHRVSWELHHGSIPDGLCVLHKCDVPACVNPDHLFLGTKADNSADMIIKGRQKTGEQLPQSKLTWAQIDAIRRCSLTHKEIATLCGVSTGHISIIKNDLLWRYR